MVSGPRGAVYKYWRPGGRCPADEFLDGCNHGMRKKFEGVFDVVTKIGASFQAHKRFTPLHGDGKPLWEFKEFDHRLYCLRTIAGQSVRIVLFSGWVKDKKGKSREEPREIERAQGLLREMQAQKGVSP